MSLKELFTPDPPEDDGILRDKYGNELVYKIMNGTTPNRKTRRQHGIRRPLKLIEQHRDLLESMAAMAEEGVDEIQTEEVHD